MSLLNSYQYRLLFLSTRVGDCSSGDPDRIASITIWLSLGTDPEPHQLPLMSVLNSYQYRLVFLSTRFVDCST